MEKQTSPALSVVSTLYQSESYVVPFCERMAAAAESFSPDYEIILVNDGSPDRSLDTALTARRKNPRVQIIDLSRNFGHHPAMITGLRYARGNHVFLIDSDLEEQPEWLASFNAAARESGADLVYGVQVRRKGGWGERLSGALFYALLNRLFDARLPLNPTTARLMSRRFIEGLLEFHEKRPYLFGLCMLAGYDQRAVPVVKAARGRSSYTLRRRFSLAVDVATAFSRRPLLLILFAGLLISFSAVCAVLYLWGHSWFGNAPISEATILLSSVWLLGGLGILAVGIVGTYLARIGDQLHARPLSLVKALYVDDDVRSFPTR